MWRRFGLDNVIRLGKFARDPNPLTIEGASVRSD
jgi:hypothetical protein